MFFNVKDINDHYNFIITGASYAGNPRPNTVMFIGKKVSRLLDNLYNVQNCLVYIDNSIDVPNDLETHNCFIKTPTPQLDYALFTNALNDAKVAHEKTLKYVLTASGYYLSETAQIGKNTYIEPGVVIGHDVIIGDNATILSGAVIKNACIGNNVIINENALIGTNGFTMTSDCDGNKIRIPTLGKVFIGDFVEIGAQDNISCGSGGNTIISDYVKIDALVHIGHDAILEKNVEITAGCIIGGFCHLKENSFIGINASIRNRITISKDSTIGMGAAVLKSVVDNGTIFAGNPAHKLEKH